MGQGPLDAGSGPETPQSFKVGPRTFPKIKSGTPGPPSKFKSGTSSFFFDKFIFFRIFHRFFYLFIFVSFLNKIQKKISTVSNRNQ